MPVLLLLRLRQRMLQNQLLLRSPLRHRPSPPACSALILLLRLPSRLPMLLIHRTGYDEAGRPVEWTRSVFRGDRFRFIAVSAL